MNDEFIPILYYDPETIDPVNLSKIANALKGFYGGAVILPKEVDLTFMDRKDLIQELKNTIIELEKEDDNE